MPEFRHKPTVVEAEQFHADKRPWPDGVYEGRSYHPYVGHVMIDTPEGSLRVSEGDWIITGIKGEKYPFKPDVFEATYELVTD